MILNPSKHSIFPETPEMVVCLLPGPDVCQSLAIGLLGSASRPMLTYIAYMAIPGTLYVLCVSHTM